MARKDREPEALKKVRPTAGSPLSEEERAIWEHAARDLKPLKDKPQRVTGTPTDAQPAAPPRAGDGAARGTARAPPRLPGAPVEPVPVRQAPPLSDLDRRKARRIGTGKVEIEGRIDLHGMTQSQAHAALHRFLQHAHAQDMRWVLVITGKGAPLDRSLGRTDTPADYAESDRGHRGVLRRNVPSWLAEPELRSIVIGFTTAAIRHGGDGALYVQLRKRREA